MDNFFDIQRFAVYGTSGAEVLFNSVSGTAMYGYGGNDSIITTWGDYVTIYSGSGNNIIGNGGTSYTGGYRVKIIAESGKDSIYNNGRYSTINAGGGNDSIENEGYYVKIYGENGNDRIKNWGNNSTINGGNGNDTITNESSNVVINGDGNDDGIGNLGSYVTIRGGAGNDTIGNLSSVVGGVTLYEASKSLIYGGDGKDTIINNAGNVVINGDGNNDIIGNYGKSATVKGGAGNDTIGNFSSVSGSTTYDASKSLIYGGDGNDSIGNSCKNVTIDGGAGKDYIENDYSGFYVSIIGGSGNDSIKNSGDYATIKSSSDNDTVYNLGEQSYIDLGGGNDSIYSGNWDKNTIIGGSGNDTMRIFGNYNSLVGGTGRDIISLSSSAYYDTIKYSNGDGNDTIYGISSTDTIKITNGKYTSVKSGNDIKISVGNGSILVKNGAGVSFKINGTMDTPPISVSGGVVTATNKFTGNSINLASYSGATKINASAASKSLHLIGNGQANSLRGGTGNDTLNGYGGNDTLTGGNGNDIFVYSAGNDVITDYTAGKDKIKLNGVSINSYSYSGNNLILKTSKGNLKVHNGKGKTITFINSSGSQSTKKYRVASSQSQTWNLICDDNFIGNETSIDDISEAKYSVTQIQTAKTELTQEQPVLTYGNSENRQ